MTSAKRITISHIAMALIILLGVSIRLYRLGEIPLSDYEAGAALDAYHFIYSNTPAGSGVTPAYSALTAFLFFLIGASNAAARLLPALAGGLLAAVPFIYRRRIGTVPALIIALGLALDPVLVGVSRLAGGATLGMALVLLAVSLRSVPLAAGLPDSARRTLAAVLAGLALLSGPDVYLGILGLLFACAGSRALGLLPERSTEQSDSGRGFSLIDLVPFLLTVLLAATLFLRFPQGLAALATSLTNFIGGWVALSGTPVELMFASLIGYQAVPLLLALLHIWNSWRYGSIPGKFVSIWFISSLLLLLIYPGREIVEMIWVLVPLWILAGLEIGRLPIWSADNLYRPLTLSAAILVLAVSFWTNLASFSYLPEGDPQSSLRLLIMGGTFLLAVLSIALVALGWDPQAALAGTVWGILAAVLFGMVASIWGTSHRSSAGLREIWFPNGQAGEVALLRATLDRLGSWNGMEAGSLEIVDQTQSASMAWALRDLEISDTLIPVTGDALPDVIFTPGPVLPDSRLAPAYRGEGFPLSVAVNWDGMTRQEWLQWWLFKEAPAIQAEVVLWARADLFLSAPDDQGEILPLDGQDEPETEERAPLENLEELVPDN